LMAVFIASVILVSLSESTVYLIALCGQSAFFLMAISGLILEKAGVRSRLVALPQYFVLANLASLLACYKFIRGERYARWEPIREKVIAAPGGSPIAPGTGI